VVIAFVEETKTSVKGVDKGAEDASTTDTAGLETGTIS